MPRSRGLCPKCYAEYQDGERKREDASKSTLTETCGPCGGAGRIKGYECVACNGRGRVTRTEHGYRRNLMFMPTEWKEGKDK